MRVSVLAWRGQTALPPPTPSLVGCLSRDSVYHDPIFEPPSEKFANRYALAHLSRIEPAVGNEVAHPFVGPLRLPGCFQIDRPRIPEFPVAIVSDG